MRETTRTTTPMAKVHRREKIILINYQFLWKKSIRNPVKDFTF